MLAISLLSRSWLLNLWNSNKMLLMLSSGYSQVLSTRTTRETACYRYTNVTAKFMLC